MVDTSLLRDTDCSLVDRVAETLTYHYAHGGWAPIEAEEREREIFDPSRFAFSPPGWFYTKIGSTLPPITKPTSPEMDRPRHIWKIVRIPYQRDRNMIRQCETTDHLRFPFIDIDHRGQGDKRKP
jgi:hypothetical protein